MNEITADDIDWAKVAAWRHAAIHNPIVGSVTTREHGEIKVKHFRLKQTPKKFQRWYRRHNAEGPDCS